LNKLNLLNDSSYKNNNKDLRPSINDAIWNLILFFVLRGNFI
jgi:hypothetical protein